MRATAGGAFPAGFVDGVAHFNAGRFFEAHEAFEELLDAVESDGRWELLVALIQVAVGYHKGRHAYPGADRMLRLGAAKLAAVAPDAYGVDVAGLRARVMADLAAAERGEPMATRLAADPPRIGLRALSA